MGYLKNCTIIQRAGDEPLFRAREDGSVTAHLSGYAVIPLEDYQALRAAAAAHTAVVQEYT